MRGIQRDSSHAGRGVVIAEDTILRGRHDGIDRTRREVIRQAVEEESTRSTGSDGLEGLTIYGETHLYPGHTGVIRHLYRTADLSEW